MEHLDYRNISLLLEIIKDKAQTAKIQREKSGLEHESVFVMDLEGGYQVEVTNFRDEVYTLLVSRAGPRERNRLFGMSSTNERFRGYKEQLRELYENLRSNCSLTMTDRDAGTVLEEMAASN